MTDQKTSEKIWDLVIIGAGAAGLATSIFARKHGLEVLLLDGREKIGAKILMSGGTRCNLTHQKVFRSDFASENLSFVNTLLKSFPVSKALHLFEELGVEVSLEETGKYFPTTNSAQTVLDAFLNALDQKKVFLKKKSKVKNILLDGDLYQVETEGEFFISKAVVISTGGLSFPTTGSDGSGYKLAKKLGHDFVETTPSLTPFLTSCGDWKSLSGLTLNVEVWLEESHKKIKSFQGSFLFTHKGFSGPVVLNISRFWIRSSQDKKVRVSFLPLETYEGFRDKIVLEAQKSPKLTVRNFLSEFIPQRLSETLLRRAGIASEIKLSDFKKDQRECLLREIFKSDLEVCGDLGYSKAEVTAGGIDLNEVNRRDMQSKISPGLFFAGEILDCDGRIGGFNFHWAWATAYVASQGVKKYLGRDS